MSPERLPEKLRESVAADLRPVRPAAGLGPRSAVVAIVAAVFASAGLAALGLRPDLADIPHWLGWGCALAGLVLGIYLASLALRESVPGQAVSTGLALALVASAAVFHLLVGIATWRAVRHLAPPAFAGGLGLSCMGSEVVLAIPAFAVTLWLVLRGFPTRARLAGLLGATGAAIISDAVNHLHCPVSDLGHVITWHGGAIVVFAAAGWMCGWIVERRRPLT